MTIEQQARAAFEALPDYEKPHSSRMEEIDEWEFKGFLAAYKLLAEDAENYRYLKKNRDVLLVTGFFGNGCINKTVEDVDAAIKAARTKGAEHG